MQESRPKIKAGRTGSAGSGHFRVGRVYRQAAAAVAYPSFSESSGSIWAWLSMLRSVPTGISLFLGTIAVSTVAPDCVSELDVAALLADLGEAGRLQPRLDFAET